MEVKKKDYGIKKTYKLVGICSIIWSTAIFAVKYTPWLIDTISGYKQLLWIFWNVCLPIILYYAFNNQNSPSADVRIAYYSLTGCCSAVTCLFLLSIYFKIPQAIYFPTIFILSAAGYFAGYRLYVHDRFHDLHNDGLLSRITRDVIFGTIAGWIISSLFSTVVVSGFIFIISFVLVSTAHIILIDLLNNRRSKLSEGLEKDRQRKMASLSEYDEKMRKINEEKAAKERAEREAREKAERERREREKAEQEYRYYQNNRHSGSDQSQQQSQSRRDSEIRHFFIGCTNKTELKRRYRQLCKKLHPDCPGGNAESFRRMQSEYEQLLKTMAA